MNKLPCYPVQRLEYKDLPPWKTKSALLFLSLGRWHHLVGKLESIINKD